MENDLVVFLFLTAVADMLVVILDNPVLAFLFCIVLGESLVKQLVIDLSDVVFDNDDVDPTADCSFFDRDCSFHIEFCGLVWYNNINFYISEDIMKIVILNGSLRKNGSTAYILHNFEKFLLNKGADVIYYDLIEQDIALCNGCCSCYRTGHCFINDDAEKISEQLKEADGIIIGTSTIASNVSGVLKIMIDRGHFVIEQLLHKKYSVCISTYENYGGSDSLKVLKNLVTLSGAYLSGAFTLKLPFNSNCAENPKLNKLSEKYAVRIFNDILKKRTYPFQRLKQNFVIKIGLKSFVLNKGKKYEAVQRRWKKLGLN